MKINGHNDDNRTGAVCSSFAQLLLSLTHTHSLSVFIKDEHRRRIHIKWTICLILCHIVMHDQRCMRFFLFSSVLFAWMGSYQRPATITPSVKSSMWQSKQKQQGKCTYTVHCTVVSAFVRFCVSIENANPFIFSSMAYSNNMIHKKLYRLAIRHRRSGSSSCAKKAISKVYIVANVEGGYSNFVFVFHTCNFFWVPTHNIF